MVKAKSYDSSNVFVLLNVIRSREHIFCSAETFESTLNEQKDESKAAGKWRKLTVWCRSRFRSDFDGGRQS